MAGLLEVVLSTVFFAIHLGKGISTVIISAVVVRRLKWRFMKAPGRDGPTPGRPA